jgi:hypothetical protein
MNMANHIRQQVLSMRGERVDFSSMVEQNSSRPALGNASVNAKGDQLGNSGVILKTQEQIEAEMSARRARTTTTPGNIKSADILTQAEKIMPDSLAPDSVPVQTLEEIIASGAIVPNKKKSVT